MGAPIPIVCFGMAIQLTVDTYGKWLPMGNKLAVNRLDEPRGSKVVAKW